MNAVFLATSDEPVYASNQLTIEDCKKLHHFLQVNTAANGDLTTTWEIAKHQPTENLTTVAKGSGF